MLPNEKLFTLLNKTSLVFKIYDRDMEKIAAQNSGNYNLNQNVQHELANKAFNTVLGESTVNLSWEECVAVFDIMGRKLCKHST